MRNTPTEGSSGSSKLDPGAAPTLRDLCAVGLAKVDRAGCIWRGAVYPCSTVKLIKQQMNGRDQVVVKADASPADLRAEAERMERIFGYQLKTGERADRVIATHPFFRGKYLLSLEPE